MKELDLTREQLYELVWEKPIAHIIKIYGGTYKEEVLEKYNIPIPENGYWSRIRAGYNIPKSPLPPRIDEAEKIVYHPREKKKRIKIEEKPTTTKKSEQVVQVMDRLVLEAQKSYQKAIKGRRDDMLIRNQS